MNSTQGLRLLSLSKWQWVLQGWGQTLPQVTIEKSSHIIVKMALLISRRQWRKHALKYQDEYCKPTFFSHLWGQRWLIYMGQLLKQCNACFREWAKASGCGSVKERKYSSFCAVESSSPAFGPNPFLFLLKE